MTVRFADSVYWIAVTKPRGQRHETVIAVRIRRSDADLVTTEDVLIEIIFTSGSRMQLIYSTA